MRARQAWAPKDPQELADFIERAATRYKDRIHIWEFLNEPIYTDYALPARPNGQRDARSVQAGGLRGPAGDRGSGHAQG